VKYTWIEFIKYIFSFLSNRNKTKKSKRVVERKRINDRLDNGYDKIDKKKEEKKKSDVKKRLDNMF
jgi:hypothetical protein